MPPAMPNTGGGGGGQGGNSVNLLGHASSGGSGIVLIKYYSGSFNSQGITNFTDIDEVSGTSNNQAAQITKNGTLIINGEFSEVD